MGSGLQIGEVAKRAGVSIDTLRYYEKMRLLPRPRRSRASVNPTSEMINASHMRVLVLICVLFCSVAAQGPKPLPEFALPQLDGQTLRSEDLKDKIVVLDFWATWCENCVEEIPAFNRLHEKYSSRGVKVIGLAVQSGWASDIQKFAVQYKMRYTILAGNDDTVSDFGIISFPATYVIGPGWKLYKKYSGSPANKSADIERDIEALLQEKAKAQ